MSPTQTHAKELQTTDSQNAPVQDLGIEAYLPHQLGLDPSKAADLQLYIDSLGDLQMAETLLDRRNLVHNIGAGAVNGRFAEEGFDTLDHQLKLRNAEIKQRRAESQQR
jgi:hypothetical protein